MKQFGKITLRATSFAAGLLLLLFTASVVFEPKSNNSTDGMTDVRANSVLGEKENTIDVLILGDSEAYSSFIPLKLWKDKGITSYVCGTPSQKISYSLEFLKKTFKTQKPKIVIMETNALFRRVLATDAIRQFAEEKISVFRYHNRWKTLKIKDLSFGTHYTDTQISKGYVYSNCVAASDNTEYMSKSAAPASINAGVNFYVNEMQILCKENGAKLIFVSTPSTVNWNKNKHDATQKYADEHGINYIDMNTATEELSIDWSSDTRDKGDHLNFSGAYKVTSYLGECLAKTGLFTDKRSISDFSQWNTDIDRFTKDTGAAL